MKPYRYISSGYYGSGRHRYRGRITKLQSQVHRPFSQYGPPPSQESSSLSHESHFSSSGNNIVNQETPAPMKFNSFAEENPISSQNNQPFGQDTANYLPPKNQKLPEYSEPHIFSNHHHDFPQQQFQQQQQQYYQEQQQQHYQEQQQQQYQFEHQDFLRQNQNFGSNQFQNQQQISDAAQFLSQNAQAISNLYETPAPNQNYGPANQQIEHVDQHLHQSNQQGLSLQVNSQPGFQGSLPSYASGVINNQDNSENSQSIERDRLISQLQIQLSNQETSGKNNNYPQSDNLAISISPSHQGSYQGFYDPTPAASPATPAPILLSPTTSTTLQPSSSVVEHTQIGSLTAAHGLRPAIVNPSFSQFGGFVPSFVSPSGFVPNVPIHGSPLFPATSLKPVADSPTHFAIPLPAFDVPQRPVHLPPSSVTRPQSDTPHHPGTSTINIPLGPVNTLLPPLNTPIVKPNPVPIIPADTPVHPAYHPTVVNPSLIYKPVKVYPVYYYPSVTYPVRKLVGAAASAHPWSYAPSYAQRRYAKKA